LAQAFGKALCRVNIEQKAAVVKRLPHHFAVDIDKGKDPTSAKNNSGIRAVR